MRKALLLLASTLFVATASAVATPWCTLCATPSGGCSANYGDSCTHLPGVPACSTTDASLYCPGHPANGTGASGASALCALCRLPSGNYCSADYGSPCNHPPIGPIDSSNPSGPWIANHCTPSQAAQFCANHAVLLPGTSTTPSPTGPGTGPGTGGTPTGPGVIEGTPMEEEATEDIVIHPS